MVKVIGLLSLVLLVAAVVIAFITDSCKSVKGEINKQLEALTKEAALFQQHAKAATTSPETSRDYGVISSKIPAMLTQI